MVNCPQCNAENVLPDGGSGTVTCAKCNRIFGIKPSGEVIGALSLISKKPQQPPFNVEDTLVSPLPDEDIEPLESDDVEPIEEPAVAAPEPMDEQTPPPKQDPVVMPVSEASAKLTEFEEPVPERTDTAFEAATPAVEPLIEPKARRPTESRPDIFLPDNPEDRRRFVRIPSVIPIHYQLVPWGQGDAPDPEIRVGFTQDLSKTGLCLEVSGLPAELDKAFEERRLGGWAIHLDVVMPDRALRIDGRLAWVEPMTHPDLKKYLLGIEFLDLEPRDAKAIARFAKRTARKPKIMKAAVIALALATIGGGVAYGYREKTHQEQIDVLGEDLFSTSKQYEDVAADLEANTHELRTLAKDIRELVEATQGDEGDDDDEELNPVDEVRNSLGQLRATIETLKKKVEELKAPPPEPKLAKAKKSKKKRKKKKRKKRRR